jgi:hypothetical protein
VRSFRHPSPCSAMLNIAIGNNNMHHFDGGQIKVINIRA